MSDLPKREVESIKKELIKEQQEVEENLKELEEEDPAKGNELAETSEPGTDAYIADSHAKTLVVEDQLKQTYKSIKKALGKIGNGTYGKCENCGKPIGIKRLLAMPIAALCLDCSAKKKK